ncbi:MAG: hypothetical protein AAEJ52_04830 [Myxococcota bacterium]
MMVHSRTPALQVHAFSRCPRCKNLFYYTTFWGNPFSTKCRHCGLGLGEDENAV